MRPWFAFPDSSRLIPWLFFCDYHGRYRWCSYHGSRSDGPIEQPTSKMGAAGNRHLAKNGNTLATWLRGSVGDWGRSAMRPGTPERQLPFLLSFSLLLEKQTKRQNETTLLLHSAPPTDSYGEVKRSTKTHLFETLETASTPAAQRLQLSVCVYIAVYDVWSGRFPWVPVP